jgi:hypothetical protein
MTTTRSRRRLVGAATAMLLVLVVTAGCSDEQRRDLGEQDVRDALAGRIETTLEDRGLAVDGDLDCTSQIGGDGTLTASCTGTVAPEGTVSGSFAGTGDVDAETCDAQLVVELDEDVVAEEPDVDCFDVG